MPSSASGERLGTDAVFGQFNMPKPPPTPISSENNYNRTCCKVSALVVSLSALAYRAGTQVANEGRL